MIVMPKRSPKCTGFNSPTSGSTVERSELSSTMASRASAVSASHVFLIVLNTGPCTSSVGGGQGAGGGGVGNGGGIGSHGGADATGNDGV